jgi:hypothetical protein
VAEKVIRAEELERLQRRGERFGLEREVAPIPGVSVPLERKFRKNTQTFATGFDVFSEDERVKKELRMHRFSPGGGKGKKSAEDEAAEAEAETQRKEKEAEEAAWKFDESKVESRLARFGAVKKREEAPPREKKETKTKKKRVRKWRLARTAVAAESAVRPDTLYLHGCDNLKTRDVFQLFGLYGPSSMEWINDSACTVSFADGFSAERALRGLGEQEEGQEVWYAAAGGRSLRLACEMDVKARYFEAQTQEERKLKEKRFGPTLLKRVGKKAQDKQLRKVKLAMQQEKRSQKEEAQAKEDGEGDAVAVVVVDGTVGEQEAVGVAEAKEDEEKKVEKKEEEEGGGEEEEEEVDIQIE